MPGPNDPNADDDVVTPAPEPPQVGQLQTGTGKVTDKEEAGADGMGTGGSAPRDGEK